MKKFLVSLSLLSLVLYTKAQSTFPVNGAPNPNHNYYAFTNCTLHLDFETVLNNATLIIKDGLVVEAGEKVSVPAEAVTYDLKGKHLYPSFIEMYSDYGMPEIKAGSGGGRGAPQMESNVKGAYGWNQAIKADVEAFKIFTINEKAADELRRMGFSTVLTSQKDGIVRGSGTLVALGNESENENIIKDKAAAFYSFSKGSSTQDYPSSLMGSIALLRQTYYDAQWYAHNKNNNEYNISLDAFNKLQDLPQIFEVRDKLSALRADKVGDEFKAHYIIKGKGDEYQRIHDIQNTFCKFIVPLNFPEAFDVEDPLDADLVNMYDLKHWEMAPANPKWMQENGIQFALTTADLKDKKNFLKNLRKAVTYGLTEKNALKALTATPAQLLGVADKIGNLKKGMIASFFISSKSIFEESTTIYENWVNGKQFKFSDMNVPDIRGKYKLDVNANNYKFDIGGEADKPNATIYLKDTLKTTVNIAFKNNTVSFNYMNDSVSLYRFSGSFNEKTLSIEGKAQLADGKWTDFKLTRTEEFKKEEKKNDKKTEEPKTGEVFYPFTSYGRPETKENLVQKFKNRLGAILIKKVTVWTNEAEGILKEQDVYIVDGKIVRIADNIEAPKNVFAKVIDGKGKHLTAGIIDEHSHIAVSEGVNEGTQASSAEVRIGDVVNSEDINIYRQLSGGVTCSQLLHGSANPIGGQSCLVKLRWGLSPEDMKYEKADGFIKFALGENVKQSNWGEANSIRFPQTRMGVEQVYFDHFTRAHEYDTKMKAFSSGKSRTAPRRDLELEALAEILNKKRFITCHSYVQSEINMLMHVADSMGFKVNTFTHILEGYKVADKMKAHGVAASTFSDWWAYKMEVMDAIPFNAAVLTKMGVTTAINSDDAEMGRRLNQEAAKSVKYGGLSEEEALKLCTLNPAKILHIDDKVGSIKVGKSADVVLWSDHPLSIYARAEKTIIDGIIYFDNEEDVKLRDEIKKERARIIGKMIAEKNKGGKVNKPVGRKQQLYHCETLEGQGN